jgi:hypothetical protein
MSTGGCNMDSPTIGRILVITGIIILVIGVVYLLGDRLGLGRMPGDIVIRRGNVSCFIPIVTSIIISIILTIIANLLFRR